MTKDEFKNLRYLQALESNSMRTFYLYKDIKRNEVTYLVYKTGKTLRLPTKEFMKRFNIATKAWGETA